MHSFISRRSKTIIVYYCTEYNMNNIIYLRYPADIGTRIIPPTLQPSAVLDDDRGPLSGLIKIRGVARIYLLGRLFN